MFKFGSGTLACDGGRIDGTYIADFAAQCAALIRSGKQAVIVSSGAQAAGLSVMDKWTRKRDIHYRQALCAVGQVELMASWKTAFAVEGLKVAQILLTRDDFADPHRTLNMRNTLFTLVDEGIIPIINENDTVSVEEIKIGDNDTLAARSAVLWSADLLVLFSDIDGLYSANPARAKTPPEFIPVVSDIAAVRTAISTEGSSPLGTGGIVTKLDAAEIAADYGISTVITSGKTVASPQRASLEALLGGTQRGTVFTSSTG